MTTAAPPTEERAETKLSAPRVPVTLNWIVMDCDAVKEGDPDPDGVGAVDWVGVIDGLREPEVVWLELCEGDALVDRVVLSVSVVVAVLEGDMLWEGDTEDEGELVWLRVRDIEALCVTLGESDSV